MYSPTLGQWMQQDPIGFEAGDDNLYRFTSDDPTNRVDPSGHAELPKLGVDLLYDNLPDFVVTYNVQLVESIPNAVGLTSAPGPKIESECTCKNGKWQAALVKYTSNYAVQLAKTNSKNGKRLTDQSVINVWVHEYQHINSYRSMDDILYSKAKSGFPKLGVFNSKEACETARIAFWNKLDQEFLDFKKKEVDHSNPLSPDPVVDITYTD